MATLANRDIPNRNNISVLVNRISGKGAFQLDNKESPAHKATGRVQVTKGAEPTLYDNRYNKFGEDDLDSYLDFPGSKSLQIEIKVGRTSKFVKLQKIYKDKEFGGQEAKGGAHGSERQETGLIEALNEAISIHENPKVKGISQAIREAYKQPGLSLIGKEPYIDIVLQTDTKKIGVSCKDVTAPSLAGGGLAGIKLITPTLLPGFYTAVKNYIKNTMKLKQGDEVPYDSVPNFYAEIPDRYINKILEGNTLIGGPVSHMYIGKMDVVYDTSSPLITLNGEFYTIAQYKKKIGKFYFRLRKRDIDRTGNTVIDFERKNTEGLPFILRAPTTNRNNVRLVIEKTVPSTGALMKIT